MFKIKYGFVISLLMFGLIMSGCSDVTEPSVEEEQEIAFDIETAKTLEDQFFMILFNPGFVGETAQVKDYQTKQELINQLKQVATASVAEEYVNSFYEELEGGLYIVPTETPPELDLSFDYNLSKINEEYYQLTQIAENNLYGNYTITIDYQYVDEQWKISNRIFRF